ncbi:MAG: chloride channel protein [Gemmatimonadota bacterium]
MRCLRAILARSLDQAKMAEHTFMVVVAVGIGCLGGLGAVGFRLLIKAVQGGAWGGWTYSLDLVRDHPWWWIILVPAVGGLIVGPLVHFFAPEAKGHGVPEVMEAVAMHSGAIRPRLVLVKSLASGITIGTGGSVGREGPIVQIGSALGSAIGQWLRVSGARLRTLAACGAAAGIAATFNAPIAGALFAVEIILGDFGVSQFSPIVISSVMATVISRHFLGDFPAFEVPPHEMVSAWELIIYGVLGVVAAAVSLAFIRLVYGLEDLFERLPIPAWLLTSVGGLLVGGLALGFPEILGVGYEATNAALWGRLGLGMLAALVLVKLLATSFTLGSGGSGGIFAPSLFLGAMTGGFLGSLAHLWFPTITGGHGAYALVGMGAVVAGATQAPITAILIIFELTSDYKLILPLMAACIVSTLITTRAGHGSMYTTKLLRRGLDIFRGQELNLLKSLCAADVMSEDMLTVHEGESLGALLHTLAGTRHNTMYVVDDDGCLVGAIDPPELRDATLHSSVLAELLVARELAVENIPTVSPEQDLDAVSRIFTGRSMEELPVVADSGALVGVISRRHLIEAYNRELLKRDMVAGIGGDIAASSQQEITVGEDYRMAEIETPGSFVGRSIREIGIRQRYGVEVLLLRRAGGPGDDAPVELVPGVDTILQRGDRLVVLGHRDELNRLRSL